MNMGLPEQIVNAIVIARNEFNSRYLSPQLIKLRYRHRG
jgi:hypothetical protein